MSKAIKSPGTATNSAEAITKKDAAILSHSFREALANITIAVMVSVVMWSCILGMSEGFQPGHGLIVPPVAENDHGE